MLTRQEKVARAVRLTAFAKKNAGVAGDVNFYMNAGEHLTQQELDQYHATKAITGKNPEPMTSVIEAGPDADLAEIMDGKPDLTLVNEAGPEAEVVAVVLSVQAAQRRLSTAQIRRRLAIENQRTARGTLSGAVLAWTRTIGEVTTPLEVAREFIAGSNAQRALRASGQIPPRPPKQHRSAIDAFAAATNYGRGAGGGSSFRRRVRLPDGKGGYTLSARPVDIHSVPGR